MDHLRSDPEFQTGPLQIDDDLIAGSLFVGRTPLDSMDTGARPVTKLHARVLIVDGEPLSTCSKEEFRPDLVLLDLQMPDTCEQKALSQLRGLLQSFGFAPLVVVAAEGCCFTQKKARIGSIDRRKVGHSTSDLPRASDFFSELAAAYLTLEREEPNVSMP
jgi:CheY-like chemotaxis protein